MVWVCGVLESFAQTDSVLTLSDCIESALIHNPELRSSEMELQRNTLHLRQSKQNLLPSVSGALSHGISTGRNVDPTTNLFVEETVNSGQAALNASVVLFDGLRMFHEIRRRSSAQEAGKLEFDGAVNNLKLDVITAYLQVLMAEDLLQQSQQQFEVTKERLRNAEINHREGNISPGDYYDIKGEYRVNMNAMDSHRQQINTARAVLARLMNVGVGQVGTLEKINEFGRVDEYSREQLFEQAQSVLPQMRAWDWRLEEAQYGVKSMQAGWYPRLSLSGGLNSFYSNLNAQSYPMQLRNFLGRFVGVNLNIPVFNQMQVRNSVKQAKLDLEDVRWQRDVALNQLRENTAKAVFDLQVTRRMMLNLEEQQQSYAESFRVAQVQFDLGATNSVVYLTAKNKLENAQNQLLIKRYEWLLQKYINDFYAGQLGF